MEYKKEYEKALRADGSGDWDSAHNIVQDIPTPEAAWIHAYLHRKEGDDWNAGYWYRRARRNFFEGSLAEEWQEMWDELVRKEP